MRVHHRNLTAFVGYCNDGTNLGLIYEYMVNGDLASQLSGGAWLKYIVCKKFTLLDLSDSILKVYTFLFAKNFIITLHDHASFIWWETHFPSQERVNYYLLDLMLWM